MSFFKIHIYTCIFLNIILKMIMNMHCSQWNGKINDKMN